MLLLITHHTQVSFTVTIHNFMSLVSGSHVKPKQTVNKQKQTVNKQRIIMHLVVKREKRKKKHKQLITSDNSSMICIHTLHHVKEGTSTHLSR